MSNLDVRSIVELAAAATLVIGLLGTLTLAMRQGVGTRTIKFGGAIMLVPVILILALEKILEPAALGTVIGAVIGYLLSGISEIATRPSQDRP